VKKKQLMIKTWITNIFLRYNLEDKLLEENDKIAEYLNDHYKLYK